MALCVFGEKSRKPTESMLREELGRSMSGWRSLIAWSAERFEPVAEEWAFSGAQWGWTLRLKRKKRTVLYMTPGRKHFLVGLVLGEKAVAAVLETDLPSEIVELVETAKKYPEGRGLRLEIRTKKDLGAVKKLAEAKMMT